jgi:hypothetical protein
MVSNTISKSDVEYKTISIRQFVLSNFVLSDRQIEDHQVIRTYGGVVQPPSVLYKKSFDQCSVFPHFILCCEFLVCTSEI